MSMLYRKLMSLGPAVTSKALERRSLLRFPMGGFALRALAKRALGRRAPALTPLNPFNNAPTERSETLRLGTANTLGDPNRSGSNLGVTSRRSPGVNDLSIAGLPGVADTSGTGVHPWSLKANSVRPSASVTWNVAPVLPSSIRMPAFRLGKP